MVCNLPESRIEAITGCMFAGKTEELLRRVRRARIASLQVELYTPSLDSRYGTHEIGSHNGNSIEAEVIDIESAADRFQRIDGGDVDVVGVDEFNFFTGNCVAPLERLADEGVRVIVTGLDKTFRGDPFEPMDKMLAVADSVTKLTAVCEVCGGEASMTQRIRDGDPAPSDAPTVRVGGTDSYEARCRSCHVVGEG